MGLRQEFEEEFRVARDLYKALQSNFLASVKHYYYSHWLGKRDRSVYPTTDMRIESTRLTFFLQALSTSTQVGDSEKVRSRAFVCGSAHIIFADASQA